MTVSWSHSSIFNQVKHNSTNGTLSYITPARDLETLSVLLPGSFDTVLYSYNVLIQATRSGADTTTCGYANFWADFSYHDGDLHYISIRNLVYSGGITGVNVIATSGNPQWQISFMDPVGVYWDYVTYNTLYRTAFSVI